MKNRIASTPSSGGLQIIPALLLAVLVSGCSAPEPPVAQAASCSPPPPKYNPANDPQPHYSILVESSPPGARIEFNDALVGTAPCRIRIPRETGKKFGYGQVIGNRGQELILDIMV